MKIQLRFATVQIGDKGELLVHSPGDVIDMDDKEAQIMIDQEQAVAIEEPKPAKKKVL